ncbi:MAG TPA: M14 family metallopeptidase [Thermoanaerobaculia bacterium]|nr:M14 family metallopeptidase [Thermoanaerobaculia bacterium]
MSAPLTFEAVLPPLEPWDGASRALVVEPSDPWITPCESSGLRATPRYDETVAYLRRLVDAAPDLKMLSIGKSGEGRDLWLVIASTDEDLTRKPLVFAQAGIHSGEIDGKDAGLMLLRDMTVRGTKRELLEHVNFLFVPIFSVDAHERFSRFSRINQRGPEEGGWRVTPRNLNLNRDYMKAVTPEMRAMLRALDRYQPDLYIDLHVTDGADYQYDITYGWNNAAAYSPSIVRWMDATFRPSIDRALADMGHIPGPLIFSEDPVHTGLDNVPMEPRFSNGYGDARHMATILVENHSLKPYDQRVLGTYVFLEETLRTIGREGLSLREATRADRTRNAKTIPLAWKVPDAAPELHEFLGIDSRRLESEISGATKIEWLGTPVTARVPFREATEVTVSVERPRAYYVPPSWSDIIERLDLHGIAYERLTSSREIDVVMYRLSAVRYEPRQFEGHVRVSAETTRESRRETFAAGTARIATDQPLGTLAALLLEPASADSLFQWGFCLSILSPAEYVEPYIMEPTAERMLAADAQLADEFRARLASDEAFRASAQARLQWFYERTPYYDDRALLYPIAREE